YIVSIHHFHLHSRVYFLTHLQPPRSTLFPYTTLFRSRSGRGNAQRRGSQDIKSARQPIAFRQCFVRDKPHAAAVGRGGGGTSTRSEEHTSELQSHLNLVCRLLLEKKKTVIIKEKAK